MKKALKRSLSFILAITLIFSSAYVGLGDVEFGGLFAVETKAATSGTTGDCTWSLDDEGTLTISGKGYVGEFDEMFYSGNPWDSVSSEIKKVVIERSISGIGYLAFADCTELTSIELPSNINYIGYGAFNNTGYYNDDDNWENDVLYIDNYLIAVKESLTSCEIKAGTQVIAGGGFENCENLTAITIPDSVTQIGPSAFRNCSNLEKVYITDIEAWCNIFFDIGRFGEYTDSNPIDNADLYINGKIATDIVIPEGVKLIKHFTFYNCNSLESVILSNSVTSIDSGAFWSCDNLEKIIIPNNETSISDFEKYAFGKCYKLTIYGVNGSYAETSAIENDIPFKSISAFGSTNVHTLSEGGTTFELYNKAKWLEHDDVLGIVNDSKNAKIDNATVEYNGKKDTLTDYLKLIAFSNLTGEIVFTAPGFQNYIIPKDIVSNFKDNNINSFSVYMTKNRKDKMPYISTVFGRVHDEKGGNQYTELQTDTLNVVKDGKYDIVITADLKGEDSATYYLSQDEGYKAESKTGVFSETVLYDEFDINKTVYAYAKTKSGKVTEPVAVNLKKITCDAAVSKLLTSQKINLLGSGESLTIGDVPILKDTEISMNFIEMPVGIELEGDSVRISFGIDFPTIYSSKTTTSANGKTKTKKEKWSDYKKSCKDVDKAVKAAKNIKEKYKEFEKVKKQRGFGYEHLKKNKKKTTGLTIDSSFMGYIEAHLTNGGIVFTDVCGSVALNFIAQYTANGFVGPAPAYFYINGGVDGAFSLELARKIPDNTVPLQFDATLNLKPKANIGGGVGTKGVASAGVYGSLVIPTNIEIMDQHLTMSLTVSIGVEGEILFWEGKKELVSGTWNALDKYFGPSKKSLGGFSEAVYSEMAEVMYSDSPKVTYSLASRDYVESTSDWLGYTTSEGEISGYMPPFYGSATTPDTTVTELQTSVYKNSQTQLVQFGDKIMLAYIEDCAERDTYNRYRLMYTVYNPSLNTWTQPKAVCDSGKMDVAPCLATDGKNVFAAWQTVKTNPTAATEEELYNAMNNMEIYSAKYDENSDSFVNVTQHTDNSTYDYSPYVTVENGSVTVYWVNAESTDFAVGEMSIHSSANSSNTLVYDNMNYVASLKASGNEISYSTDIDGDLTTVNDVKLFSNGVQIGEGVVYDSAVITNFSYGDFNGKETLFYTDGSTVYYIENGESIEAFSDNGGVADTLYITNLNGNPAVIYAQLTDTGSELRISTLKDDKWSEPVFLTDIGCSLSNVDVVSVDGKLYSVLDRTQTFVVTDEITGEDVIKYGQTDLCMLTSLGYYDLEVSCIGYEESDISLGSSPFIVVVENKGTESINNVEFTISDTLGYSETITKDVNLAPGAVEGVELEYLAQEGYSACDLTVLATIVGESDVDTSNNTLTEQIGRTDISVGTITTERLGDIYKINCEVKNDSLVEATNVNATISFGIYQKNVDVGNMAANSTNMVELLVAKNELEFDEYGVCTLTFSATTDSEEIVLGNNQNTVSIDNSEKLVEHVHNFVDGACSSCGMSLFSYDVLADGIVVTGYAGNDTEISIPDTIDGLTVTAIGDSAFVEDEAIISVVIPDSVKTIGENAFGESSALKYIFFAGSGVEWESITIGANNNSLSNAVVHYNSSTHSNEYKVVKEATCTSDGLKTFSCTVCEYVSETIIIPATGHKYVNDVCSICCSEYLPESSHPYSSNCDESWTIYREDATSVSITFSTETQTESGYDYIYIYDGNNNQIGKYSGTSLAGKTITIDGDTVVIRLKSDGSNQKYGFLINKIEAIYEECTHSETEIRNATKSDYNKAGYTGDVYCIACGELVSSGSVVPQLKPATPKLSSVANTPTGVKFVWSKVTGADSYVVYRRTYNASTKTWSGWANIAKGVKTNSYLDTTAKSGTYYIYTVRAGNEAGYSGYNATGLKTYCLATPTLASVTNSATGVTVKWGKVTGATCYVVYRRAYNTTTKKWSGWTNLGKTTGVSFADKTAKSGNYYIYTVKALAGTYTSSYNTTGLKTYFLSAPPLSKVASTTSGVKFTWGKVTGASGYIVYRRTYNATTKTWSGWTNLGKTTSASFVDKSAKKGTYYIYTTKAYYGSYTSAYNTTGLKVKDVY